MTHSAATGNRLEPVTGQRTSARPGGETSRHLTQYLEAPSEARIRPDLAFDHLHHELLAAERRLLAADSLYTADRAQLVDLEQRFQEARSNLRQRYRRILRFLREIFRFHLPFAVSVGPPPDVGPELVRYVTPAIDLLRHLVTSPPPILEPTCDVAAMAADLESDVGDLDTATAGLETARAAIVASRSRLEAAMAETDAVLLRSRRLLNSLSQLADEHEPG